MVRYLTGCQAMLAAKVFGRCQFHFFLFCLLLHLLRVSPVICLFCRIFWDCCLFSARGWVSYIFWKINAYLAFFSFHFVIHNKKEKNNNEKLPPLTHPRHKVISLRLKFILGHFNTLSISCVFLLTWCLSVPLPACKEFAHTKFSKNRIERQNVQNTYPEMLEWREPKKNKQSPIETRRLFSFQLRLWRRQWWRRVAVYCGVACYTPWFFFLAWTSLFFFVAFFLVAGV